MRFESRFIVQLSNFPNRKYSIRNIQICTDDVIIWPFNSLSLQIQFAMNLCTIPTKLSKYFSNYHSCQFIFIIGKRDCRLILEIPYGISVAWGSAVHFSHTKYFNAECCDQSVSIFPESYAISQHNLTCCLMLQKPQTIMCHSQNARFIFFIFLQIFLS